MMSTKFRMQEDTLRDYRALRFRENSERQCFYIPVGFVLWEDEYPGENRLPMGDKDARRTMLSLYAARWHYWMDKVIPEAFADLWDEAQQQIPEWPGFKRLDVDNETIELARLCREAEAELWEAFTTDADDATITDDGNGLSEVSITYDLTEDGDAKLIGWRSRIKRMFRQDSST